MTGATARTLGVRSGLDLIPAEDGQVRPECGGLPVSPDDPQRLPTHRRPPEFGGTGKDPLWQLRVRDLGPGLIYRPDPANPAGHGFLEPAMPMSLAEFQEALAKTQDAWRLVVPEEIGKEME